MAGIAAVASFFPELQPWIVGAGVVLVAGGWPVLGSRRIVGRFTAAWALLALMGVGTPVGFLTASAPRAVSVGTVETPAARSVAAPLAEGSQTAPPVVSDKVGSQVAEHIASARDLFGQSEYAKALLECERALAIDPQNRDALWLKEQITKIQDALQGKTH
jgi:hypothetical protein